MITNEAERIKWTLRGLLKKHPEQFEELRRMAEVYRETEGGDPQCFLCACLTLTYGIGENPHQDRWVANELGITPSKVHFYRKVALWILGRKQHCFRAGRGVAMSAERIQRVFQENEHERAALS